MTKEEKLRKLAQITHAGDAMHRTMMWQIDQVALSLLGPMAALLDELKKELVDKILNADIQMMAEETIISAYTKLGIPEETIDGLIAFYESPEGKVLADALPDLQLEAAKRGKEIFDGALGTGPTSELEVEELQAQANSLQETNNAKLDVIQKMTDNFHKLKARHDRLQTDVQQVLDLLRDGQGLDKQDAIYDVIDILKPHGKT
jgi:hypothetical protein